ncbi:extracellular solute-binding protein, partial [Aerococcus sp. L_32]|uniref:extracellular solute-binding protein n=1 Tax=Aerococcus sp. L_32 TaxID=3422316 RepID=UPI003D6A2CF0
MKTFKKLRYLVIASASVLALAACGNTEETSTNGKTVIEFFNQKKEMEGTIEEIIQDFEKLHPDIDVQMTSVPDAGTVIKTRMLSGDVPDVINLYPQNIDFQEWANAGFFYDMTGQDYLDNLKNQYADKYAINGKVYNVPLTANVSGIYYNKTKFEALGLKAPETWDEFVQLVDEIKAAGETPF